jgi:hypothetical protein
MARFLLTLLQLRRATLAIPMETPMKAIDYSRWSQRVNTGPSSRAYSHRHSKLQQNEWWAEFVVENCELHKHGVSTHRLLHPLVGGVL